MAGTGRGTRGRERCVCRGRPVCSHGALGITAHVPAALHCALGEAWPCRVPGCGESKPLWVQSHLGPRDSAREPARSDDGSGHHEPERSRPRRPFTGKRLAPWFCGCCGSCGDEPLPLFTRVNREQLCRAYECASVCVCSCARAQLCAQACMRVPRCAPVLRCMQACVACSGVYNVLSCVPKCI